MKNHSPFSLKKNKKSENDVRNIEVMETKKKISSFSNSYDGNSNDVLTQMMTNIFKLCESQIREYRTLII